MSKIHVRPAHFESKQFIAENSIVFHRQLSDSTKLLILAIHAIFSNTKEWTIVQSDLKNRMGWGKEKMRCAIREAERFGYLRVTQQRFTETKGIYQKGQYAPNEFEFDIKGGYIKDLGTKENEKPSHNECEPLTGFQAPTNQAPVNRPLPCSLSRPLYKEQQQTPKEESTNVVVVPLDSEIQKKHEALSPYGFDDRNLSALSCLPLGQIVDAVAAYEQYKEHTEVSNPQGWIRNAIIGKWKPNSKKIDPEELRQQKESRTQQILKENVHKAKSLIARYAEFFTVSYQAALGDKVVHLRYVNSVFPLSLLEDDCISVLNHYLESNKPE